jgi:hypothetical protein
MKSHTIPLHPYQGMNGPFVRISTLMYYLYELISSGLQINFYSWKYKTFLARLDQNNK